MYSKNGGRNRPLLYILIIMAIFVVTLFYTGSASGVISRSQSVVLAVVAPLQKGVAAVASPIRGAFSYIADFGRVRRVNFALERDNRKLKVRIKELRAFKADNERLRRLAGFRRQTALETVGATVISRSPTSWQSVATIDFGGENGVKKGMAVVTDKGLVGHTVKVAGSAALIQLIDDRHSGVAVEVERTGGTAVCEGSLEGKLKLRFMPNDADVKLGDKVITSGVGGVYPRGILVGTISKIDRAPYSIEKLITLKPGADIKRLREVLIVVESPRTRVGR